MHCEFCDKPAQGFEARSLHVYPDAYAVMPDTVWYCSERCEERDDGDWRPEWCDQCERDIRYNDDHYDLRQMYAPQFVVDGGGNLVCRRCAGIPADAEIPVAWR